MHVVKGFTLASVAIVSLSLATTGRTWAEPSSACSLAEPPHAATRASIFNPQQGQWLGEAEADMVEPGLVLQAESASAYVTRIGQRLVAVLPSTPIHYSFQVFESDELAGFALAGGHIYVSRKLLLDARSEDEVAAMLAHEIGRAYIHNSASLVTLRLEKLLGVHSVGGQADIEDKLQRLLNAPSTNGSEPKPGDRDKDEMIADRVALYALIKAGYIPEALTAFLDRSGGNSDFAEDTFTELFDFESDPSVRAAQAHKVYGELPGSCSGRRPRFWPGFRAFEDALRNSRIDPDLPPSPGLNSIALTPPMNPALLNVRLSPDARFVLAQDESKIHVLSADPLKLIFSIDARGAKMAQFTPDSKSVVFEYPGLRVENWDVASQQRAGVLDWVDYDGCAQSSLSPDGLFFACLSPGERGLWLRVMDLGTGQFVYQDRNFPSPLAGLPSDLTPEMLTQLIGLASGDLTSSMRWSQNGQYLLCANRNALFALDLKTLKPVTTPNDVLNFHFSNSIQFVDSIHLVYSCRDLVFGQGLPKNICFAPFPNGEILDRFNLDETLWIAPVTRGPHVLAGPFDGAAARVLDPATGNLGQKFKLETVDLSGDTVAQEKEAGGLSVGELGGAMQTAPLPVTPIRSFEAADISADGRYVALSDRARGAVWDLITGNRLKVTHPFRIAAFDSRGALEAIQVEQELKPAGNGAIDRETGKAASSWIIGSRVVEIGDVIVEVKSRAGSPNELDVDLAVSDAATRKALWSKHSTEGLPRILPADGGRLLLTMPWASKAREEEVRSHKDILIRTSDARKKDDDTGLLIEVVNSRTGLAERLILVPTAEPEAIRSTYVALYDNLLAVAGDHNNTTIYHENDGARLFSLFGTVLAGDGSLGLIAARNRPQELTLYSAAHGNQLGHWMLDSKILTARIVLEKKQLLALTATQHVYRLDLPAAVANLKQALPFGGQDGR
jgi:hypothetical protein